MLTTRVERYAASRTRQGQPARGHRQKRATWGFPLAVGVFTILCMGSPAPAEEPAPGRRPQGILAAIAVPNFISYRNKSDTPAGVASGERSTAGAGTGQRSTAGAASGERSTAGAATGGRNGAAVECSEDATEDPLESATTVTIILDALCQ